MFQPTTPLLGGRLRRLPLTTKVAGRGFYKGNRVGSMGWHTKYGGYIIDYSKVRSYVVPKNLGECKLTPFVTLKKKALSGYFDGDPKGGFSGARYLANWKEQNGMD